MKQMMALFGLLLCIFITACNNTNQNYKTMTCTNETSENGVLTDTTHVIRYQEDSIIEIKSNYLIQLEDKEMYNIFETEKKKLEDTVSNLGSQEQVFSMVKTDTDKIYHVQFVFSFANLSASVLDKMDFSKDIELQKTMFETKGFTCK